MWRCSSTWSLLGLGARPSCSSTQVSGGRAHEWARRGRVCTMDAWVAAPSAHLRVWQPLTAAGNSLPCVPVSFFARAAGR